MKKKVVASLSVGSAVAGVSLAPLSVQATTTGNTPIAAAFEGGMLPDGNDDVNIVDPDPSGSNNNSDLLSIPRELNSGRLSVSDDLTKPILNQRDPETTNGYTEVIGIDDVRGSREGWHLAA